MHTMPRPWVVMKFTASGVTRSAAITKSPSFSRPGSSTTMTISPRPMASTASSAVENGDGSSSTSDSPLLASSAMIAIPASSTICLQLQTLGRYSEYLVNDRPKPLPGQLTVAPPSGLCSNP